MKLTFERPEKKNKEIEFEYPSYKCKYIMMSSGDARIIIRSPKEIICPPFHK